MNKFDVRPGMTVGRIKGSKYLRPIRVYFWHERLVRWLGRVLHIDRWRAYHEIIPYGIVDSVYYEGMPTISRFRELNHDPITWR